MNNKSTQLAKFSSSINKLMQCEAIVANKYIADLLEVVAQSNQLTKCIADTIKVNTYSIEFNRAVVSNKLENGKTINSFKLPDDANRVVMLVTCILVEVDSGKRNFIKLLQDYFTAPTLTQSYQLFVDNVLNPFKDSCEAMLRSDDADSLDFDALERAGEFFKSQRIYINIAPLRQCLALIENTRNVVRQLGANINKQLAKDCLFACDVLNNALQLKNAKWIAIAWLGFKYSVGQIDREQTTISSLQQILAENKLI